MNAKTLLLFVLFFAVYSLFCLAEEQGKKETVGQSMSAGDISVIWVQKPMHEIYPKNLVWENGRIYSKDKNPCFVIDVAVIPFEFCVLPWEISDFDKIGSLEQYNFTKLNAEKEIAAQKAKIDPKYWGYLSGKPYVRLAQNQIMILRQGKKCVAFKPVEAVAKYNSWEETPAGNQYLYSAPIDKNGRQMKATKTDKHAPPIWKSMVYEWKVLSGNNQGDTASVKNYESSQGTSSATFVVNKLIGSTRYLQSGDEKKCFNIPGVDSAVDFSFSKDFESEERVKKFKLPEYSWRINHIVYVSVVEKAGAARTGDEIEDIKDPSSYKFRNYSRMAGFAQYFANCETIIFKPDDCLRITTIYRLNNSYVAIRLIKIENDQIFYQWKYWPLVLSPADVEDQKQAKQQADIDEANKKSSVRTCKAQTLKNFYLAGVNFSWEVPEKPQQETLTLNYEVKLKSADSLGLALAEENEIRDIVDPSLYAFKNFNESHGSAIVSLNRPIVFRIGNRYAAIRLLKIERNGAKSFVVYQWKYWPEAKPLELAKTAQD